MIPQKLALILFTSALLAATSYASTTPDHMEDEPAASSEQREAVSGTSDDSEVLADAQSASPDTATPPVPADPTTEPVKKPLCKGFGDCTVQVVKGVIGGILLLPLVALMVLGGGG